MFPRFLTIIKYRAIARVGTTRMFDNRDEAQAWLNEIEPEFAGDGFEDYHGWNSVECAIREVSHFYRATAPGADEPHNSGKFADVGIHANGQD